MGLGDAEKDARFQTNPIDPNLLKHIETIEELFPSQLFCFQPPDHPSSGVMDLTATSSKNDPFFWFLRKGRGDKHER